MVSFPLDRTSIHANPTREVNISLWDIRPSPVCIKRERLPTTEQVLFQGEFFACGSGKPIRKRCLHFAECVLGLPEVFDVKKRPWIQPQNASAVQVAEVMRRCPSAALHYRLQGSREDPEQPIRAAVCGTPKG